MERTDPSAVDGSAKLVGRLEFLRRNNVSPARNMVERGEVRVRVSGVQSRGAVGGRGFARRFCPRKVKNPAIEILSSS